VLETRRLCAWCRSELAVTLRRDARTCSQGCRQALARFRAHLARATAADRPARLAYADPPYPGLSGYYRGHPDYAGEVDHGALVARLQGFDGWALSTSAAALPEVLRLLDGVPGWAVASWYRGGPHPRSRRPWSAWEPVIYRPARDALDLGAPPDALCYVSRARTTDPARVIGAKPAAFAAWIFGLLGASLGDTLADLYPGSGGIGRAWDLYQRGELSRHAGGDVSPGAEGDGSGAVAEDLRDGSGGAAHRGDRAVSTVGLHGQSPVTEEPPPVRAGAVLPAREVCPADPSGATRPPDPDPGREGPQGPRAPDGAGSPPASGSISRPGGACGPNSTVRGGDR